ncbi:ribosome biogenesis GTPase YqeH [Thalassobacillus sp. CUG 92003]|uniref:ribosome biogenesis GTPase YqeH n=1 Tax=Thalassobacillus sp. CUG 92003 TaxID=2736641 RepID=UPI0015E6A9A4|nr:ribosome biogenesis GTPase YqeH [Thalassobacillus sp. CUG 92003]
MSVTICQGCGAEIQSEDPAQPGYAPPSALQREDVICKRCFRLKHYNEVQDIPYQDDAFLTMLHQIGDRDALVVNIVDIFDFNGSFLPGLSRLTGHNPVLLVGNKMDILPKAVNHNRVKQWLRQEAKEQGLLVKDVELVSAEKGHGMEQLMGVIDRLRDHRDVYVVGTTNVGKSTFINRLIEYSSGMKDAITTSYFPGTTLGFIDISLDDESALFDTPGIIQRHQMAHYVSERDLKIITPHKEIKPRNYQLQAGQTLYFGGLARMDFEKGDPSSFVCYFANELVIHRTKTENAEHLYTQHLGELLSPPDEKSIDMLPRLKPHTFSIEHDKTDIVISGLGWITIPHAGVTVTIHAPSGVKVALRESLI